MSCRSIRPALFLPLALLLTTLTARAQLRSVEPPEQKEEEGWSLEKLAMQLGTEQYLIALDHLAGMRSDTPAEKSGPQPLAFSAWRSIGPTRVLGSPGRESNGTHGRIRCVKWYFEEGAWRTYAGASGGGMWEGTESGFPMRRDWRSLGDNLPNPSVGAVSVRRAGVGVRHLYAGTGDWGRSFGTGLYKSRNNGLSWEKVRLTRAGVEVTPGAFTDIIEKDIYWDPARSPQDTMYVSSGNGFFRSTDFGETWRHRTVTPAAPEAPIYDLVVDPLDFRTLYAALPQRGVFKSTDGGDTWSAVNAGLPIDGRLGMTMALAIAPSDRNRLYVSLCDTAYQPIGVFRTTNGGTSWQPTGSYRSQLMNGQAFHVHTIAVHPTDAQTVYVASVQCDKSTDGGATWAPILAAHSDHTMLTFDPRDPGVMMIASDGGVHLRIDATGFFQNASEHFLPGAPLQIDGMDIAATDPNLIVSGTQDNGTIVARLDGGTVQWREVQGGDGGNDITIDPTNAQRMFMNEWSGPSPRYRSLDGGRSMQEINNGLSEVPNYTPLKLNKGTFNVFTVDSTRLYFSTNDGGFWQGATSGPRDFPSWFVPSSLAVGMLPGGASICYVGSPGAIYVAEGTPGSMTLRPPVSLPGGAPVASIEIDRSNGAIAYALTNAAPFTPYRSTDRGATWSSIAGSAPAGSLPAARIRTIMSLPSRPQILFAGTDIGVFKSDDGGASWYAYQYGLPIVPVTRMALVSIPLTGVEMLRIATYGRGWWERDITGDDPLWVRTDTSLFTGGVRQRCPGNQDFCRLFFDVAHLRGLVIDKPPIPPAGSFIVGGRDGTILRALDGGLLWESVKTPATGHVVKVKPLGDLSAVAITDLGEIMRTDDVGATWTPLISPGLGTLRGLQFVDSATGWAVGDSGLIMRTVNGGFNWTQERIDFGIKDIYPDILSLSFSPDMLTGWGIVADPATKPATIIHVRTFDGGANWQQEPAPAQFPLHAVLFVDHATLYAVGDEGTIVKSVDSGATWFDLPSGTTSSLQSLDFSDPDNGRVTGFDGTVLRTSDGGASWTDEEIETTDEVIAIASDRETGGIDAVAITDTTILHRYYPLVPELWEDWPVKSVPDFISDTTATDTTVVDTTKTDTTKTDTTKTDTTKTDTTTSVRTHEHDLSVESIAPNPFSGRTLLLFTLGRAAMVRVGIYNAAGEEVCRLAQEHASGRHAIEWNGADDGGGALPDGIYFWRIAIDGAEPINRQVVLRR